MSSKQTIFKALSWASSFLTDHGRDANAGEILLRAQLNMSRSTLLAEQRMPLSDNEWKTFEASVEEHAAGKPVQHIIGFEEFYGREFKVNSNVLIPRPETEELIMAVLQRMEQFALRSPGIKVADIGTGSGIIAVTLKLEKPELTVFASDLSEEALAVAKENADCLKADIQFLQGDLLQPFMERNMKLDIIVSNPPYIPEGELLSDTVRDYDPSTALFGGADGLDFYRRFARDLPKVLNDQAMAAFEIGHGQGEAVSQMLKASLSNSSVEVIEDINGKERIVIAVR